MATSATQEQELKTRYRVRKAIIALQKLQTRRCTTTSVMQGSTARQEQERLQRPRIIVLKLTSAHPALDCTIIQLFIPTTRAGEEMHPQGVQRALALTGLTLKGKSSSVL